MLFDPDQKLTQKQVAELCGISARTVTNRITDGSFPKELTIRNLLSLQLGAPKKIPNAGKERKSLADAEIAELKLAQLKGELVPATLIADKFNAIGSEFIDTVKLAATQIESVVRSNSPSETADLIALQTTKELQKMTERVGEIIKRA
jgi:transcriptional regulator with XRE-family HTH domain